MHVFIAQSHKLRVNIFETRPNVYEIFDHAIKNSFWLVFIFICALDNLEQVFKMIYI